MAWKLISRKPAQQKGGVFASIVSKGNGLYLSSGFRDMDGVKSVKSFDIYREGYNLALVPRTDDAGTLLSTGGTIWCVNILAKKDHPYFTVQRGTINNQKGFILKPRKEHP